MKSWERHFLELGAFRRRKGHCAVPPNWSENPDLARWVAVQRTRPDGISVGRLRRLFRLGFDFGPWNTRWIRRFLELVSFGRRHGHFHVPSAWPRNPSLANWVALQRRTLSRLPLTRRRLLARFPFEGTLRDTAFDQRMAQLRCFRSRFGHCRVPAVWPQNLRLARWVRRQRERRSRLSVDKRRRLEALGFVWNRFEWQWERNFRQLQAFRRRKGHCRVPAGGSPQSPLGHWVSRQRRRRAKLSRAQVHRLNALGFEWHIPHSPTSSLLATPRSTRATHRP
ncbi:MAG: helicase associated domain-containing protein [Verrucomicrobiae bacterium]|nr:helicase associated domain-containing protein [Verrucomicrobiae bacterium]